jgi:hypothetical protein
MHQEHWIADRAMLQRLLQLHPEWTQQELADWIGRSKGWVKKWVKRLREAPPGVQPQLVVDNLISLCKRISGSIFHHDAVQAGHRILEEGSIRRLLRAPSPFSPRHAPAPTSGL